MLEQLIMADVLAAIIRKPGLSQKDLKKLSPGCGEQIVRAIEALERGKRIIIKRAGSHRHFPSEAIPQGE